jgi:hypothetical protein
VRCGWLDSSAASNSDESFAATAARSKSSRDAITTGAMLSGIDFSTMTARTSADGPQVGGGLFVASGTGIRLGYDGDVRSGYTAHAGQLEVRIQYEGA